VRCVGVRGQMWTCDRHSADPVRGGRPRAVPRRRGVGAGRGTDPHPWAVVRLADGL